MTLTRVNTNGITDGTVGTADLADGAVTEGKLGAAAVTTAKVANSAITTAKMAFDGGALTTRNRIINGDMRIDQRNNGAALAASGNFPVDRWIANWTTGAFTMQRVVDAPAGFTHSIRFTVTTPDASITADEYLQCYQLIEGFNASDLAWGTANAQTVTVSFWVKSSSTGSFGFSLRDQNAAISYPSNFSINAANTWEYKTITVPGPTSGTWGTGNDRWGYVTFAPIQGPSSQGTANTWASGNFRAATGITNTWAATNGATFQVTGVQLEAGPTATPFERRPIGQELQLCQRYYEKSFDIDTAPANGSTATAFAAFNGLHTGIATNRQGVGTSLNFAVPKRAAPTVVGFGNSSGQWAFIAPSGTALSWNSSVFSAGHIGTRGFKNDQQVVDGAVVFVLGHWAASAEL